jgi:hypothetical protein
MHNRTDTMRRYMQCLGRGMGEQLSVRGLWSQRDEINYTFATDDDDDDAKTNILLSVELRSKLS